jgi:class 3 adenylate cyclase
MYWKKKASQERIEKAIGLVQDIKVVPFVRDMSLDNIPLNRAYQVDGCHIYIEIPNAISLLGSGDSESVRSHQRYLRYLHIYQRICHLVFLNTPAIKVDFQNQRLHFIMYKPYGDRSAQVCAAVAIGEHIRQVIGQANELHGELPDAVVCVGIEAGISLAVRNGTGGDREPLFVGNPANHAAKMLASGRAGIFLGPQARASLGQDWEVSRPANTPLTKVQIDECVLDANLGLDVQEHLEEWAAELQGTPQSDFAFSRPTPPLSNLALDDLTPANSRRDVLASIYADIDGFTNYVAAAIEGGTEADAIRVLHVVRKELRDVLKDFGGRKVRYIGDCVHGILSEGASATDVEATVSTSVLCAAGMHASFELILEEMPEAAGLGLQIGIETGPTSVTRLGMRNSRSRCAVGRAVIGAEDAQKSCHQRETALGANAQAVASEGVKRLVSTGRVLGRTSYNSTVTRLDVAGDRVAKRILAELNIPAVDVPKPHSHA